MISVPSLPMGHAAKHRFTLVYALIVIALGLFAAYFATAKPVRVERVYVTKATVDAKNVAASLSQRQVIDGANLGLKSGTVCYFGANSSGVFVVCPA